MGESTIVSLAALSVSIVLVTQIFTSGFIPIVTEISDSYNKMTDRIIEKYQTEINIGKVYDAGWRDTNWNYLKIIIIDHTKVKSNLKNFPVLIYLKSDADLASKAQDNSNDIMFISSNNSIKYNHEIKSFNSSTGELTAWVNIESLSANKDTVLYMYYNNSKCSNQESFGIKIKECTVLVNGRLMSFIDLQSELYSEKNTNIFVNVSAAGSKRIKFITSNGISDCVEYG